MSKAKPAPQTVHLLDGYMPFASCPITQGTLMRLLLRTSEGACHAALARHHGGRLVTFDAGLAALHTDVAVGLK